VSIESKHAYRFGFLKSEAWKDIRIEIFLVLGMKCHVCGVEDFSNDIHHFCYPRNLYNTKPFHVRVLCRRCHALVHEIMELMEMPTNITAKKKVFFRICEEVRAKLEIPQLKRVDIKPAQE
jgi:hypothetical protein